MKAHLVSLCLVLAACGVAPGNEPITVKDAKQVSDSKKDEPLAKAFSLPKAVEFLDRAAAGWTKERGCFACHTNYAYLYARPLLKNDAPVHREIREALEEMVTKRWPDKGPRWDAEVVTTAAALAFHDRQTTGKLHPTTRTALDRIWSVQKDHGGFSWLKCNWPPMENDDHYGATLALLAVGYAPESYAQTPKATEGVAKIRKYLEANTPENTHHRLMLLWASTVVPDILTEQQKNDVIKEMRSLQRPDGGWASGGFGSWKRGDKTEQDRDSSDGYGTGFTIYVLRQAGVPANDSQLQKGIAWLKGQQRESGRWFSRSLFRDNKHYLSHAGSAFAVMALASCGEERIVRSGG